MSNANGNGRSDAIVLTSIDDATTLDAPAQADASDIEIVEVDDGSAPVAAPAPAPAAPAATAQQVADSPALAQAGRQDRGPRHPGNRPRRDRNPTPPSAPQDLELEMLHAQCSALETQVEKAALHNRIAELSKPGAIARAAKQRSSKKRNDKRMVAGTLSGVFVARIVLGLIMVLVVLAIANYRGMLPWRQLPQMPARPAVIIPPVADDAVVLPSPAKPAAPTVKRHKVRPQAAPVPAPIMEPEQAAPPPPVRKDPRRIAGSAAHMPWEMGNTPSPTAEDRPHD